MKAQPVKKYKFKTIIAGNKFLDPKKRVLFVDIAITRREKRAKINLWLKRTFFIVKTIWGSRARVPGAHFVAL